MTTSRDRLLTAISGREADRVPINCYEMNAYDPDDWYNKQESYKPLMALIREKTDCICPGSLPISPFGNAAYAVADTDTSHKKSGGSIETEKWCEGISTFTRTTYNTPKGQLQTLHRADDNVNTVWTMEHLFKTIDDIDKYFSIPIDSPGEFNLNDFAAKQKNLADNGIMTVTVSDPICEVAEFFEMGEFLVFAMTETKKIKSFMDYIHEHQMVYLKAVLSQCGKFDINLAETLFRICGPEYASEPYLPPRYFPDFVTGYVTAMTELIHSFDGKVRFHCHGRIASIIDEIAKTGADAIDPVEPPPDGDIELSQVKKRLGDRMCLFGNIEVKLLEYGSSDEIRNFVINAMAQAKSGGGYVIMPTASPIGNPLSSKTLDNYATFIETALEHGQY